MAFPMMDASEPHTSKVRMIRSELVEDFIRRKGVTFEYVPDFDLREIDLAWSLKHLQARANNPVDTKVIDSYERLMRTGWPFLPIVVWKFPTHTPGVTPGKTYAVLGGQHRTRAGLRFGTLFGTYIVDTGTNLIMRDQLARELNALEAIIFDALTDRLEQAKAAIRTEGITYRVAGERFGLSPGQVGDAMREDEIKHRLEKLGIDPNKPDKNKLSTAVLLLLWTVQNDNVLRHATTDLIRRARYGGDKVKHIVLEVNQARTEAEGMAVVDNWLMLDSTKEAIAAAESNRKGTKGAITSGAKIGGHRPHSEITHSQINVLLNNLTKHPTWGPLGFHNADSRRNIAAKMRELMQRMTALCESIYD